MAGWIKFHRINRKIHFFTSIVIFAFSLLYVISGFIMTRHDWFPIGEIERNSKTYPLTTQIDTSRLEDFGMQLKDEYELSGRMNFKLRNDGAINYNFNHPGEGFNVWIPMERDSLYITRSVQKHFGGIARQFHHFHGYNGGLLYYIWAFIYDITAISMIVFSITGIVIWYKNRKRLKLGWVIITISLLFFIITTIALTA